MVLVGVVDPPVDRVVTDPYSRVLWELDPEPVYPPPQPSDPAQTHVAGGSSMLLTTSVLCPVLRCGHRTRCVTEQPGTGGMTRSGSTTPTCSRPISRDTVDPGRPHTTAIRR